MLVLNRLRLTIVRASNRWIENPPMLSSSPPSPTPPSSSRKRWMLNLLDRALIGLLVFVVLVLLGMQAVHAG